MEGYELNRHLDALDDAATGYDAEQVLADACRNPHHRYTACERETLKLSEPQTLRVANLVIQHEYAVYVASEDVAIELDAPQREFNAYDVWDYHTSAAGEMKWKMDKRKRAFEAKMKQWKRILEMYERGELQ
jgi:hypothetical protein